MHEWSSQATYGVRLEWGLSGARALSAACFVVVDVLSFSTSVTVLVESGTRVFPYSWRDGTAAAFADKVGARLAVGRSAMTPQTPWSLSPAALTQAPRVPALVLPSPNGSMISAAISDALVVAGCLRNASAIGAALTADGFGTPQRPVAVIAAGEKWPDGQQRWALEDLLGAGAVVAAMGTQALCSPEAEAARACYLATPDVPATLAACSSGRELRQIGFAEDVEIAAEVDRSDVVPALSATATGELAFAPFTPVP